MLKKYLHIIFSISLSLFFVIAGSGFNIVNYCCDICESEGIEHVAGKSCALVHYKADTCCSDESEQTTHNESNNACHTHSDDYACTDIHHKTDKCHLLRVTVDLPVLNAAINNEIEFQSSVFVVTFVSVRALCADVSFIHNDLAPPDILPISSGRALLLKKAVLTI
jgi:hypothetical protein